MAKKKNQKGREEPSLGSKAGIRRDGPPEPHDRSYRRFFAHREMVEDVLRGFVKRGWIDDLDFSTLVQLPDVFVGDDLERRAADAIWRVNWRNQKLYICLAFEFQSGIDRFMAVRWMVYIGMLYQRLIENRIIKAGDRCN